MIRNKLWDESVQEGMMRWKRKDV